jgi:hypothetical protein
VERIVRRVLWKNTVKEDVLCSQATTAFTSGTSPRTPTVRDDPLSIVQASTLFDSAHHHEVLIKIDAASDNVGGDEQDDVARAIPVNTTRGVAEIRDGAAGL